MSSRRSVLRMLLGGAALVAAGALAPADRATAQEQAVRRYVVGISGMVWRTSCTQKVRETFQKMDAVDAVQIDFEAKTVTVTTKPGKTLSRDAVEKAFAGSSYGVTTFAPHSG